MISIAVIDHTYALDSNNIIINGKLTAYVPPIAYLRIIFK